MSAADPNGAGGWARSSLGLDFKDPELLTQALTHRSHAFEVGGVGHNERLEFLGDAVLGLIVTDVIFERYPDMTEGEMAKLRANTVNAVVLAEAARKIGLGSQILLGKGEQLSGGAEKASILADGFEAVLGAMYLDAGLEACRALVEKVLGDHLRLHGDEGVVRDFKTNLQELAARLQGELPEYRITSTGPDHAKKFRARVYVAGRKLGQGEGRSKKEAEQAAAQQALEQMEAIDA